MEPEPLLDTPIGRYHFRMEISELFDIDTGWSPCIGGVRWLLDQVLNDRITGIPVMAETTTLRRFSTFFLRAGDIVDLVRDPKTGAINRDVLDYLEWFMDAAWRRKFDYDHWHPPSEIGPIIFNSRKLEPHIRFYLMRFILAGRVPVGVLAKKSTGVMEDLKERTRRDFGDWVERIEA